MRHFIFGDFRGFFRDSLAFPSFLRIICDSFGILKDFLGFLRDLAFPSISHHCSGFLAIFLRFFAIFKILQELLSISIIFEDFCDFLVIF